MASRPSSRAQGQTNEEQTAEMISNLTITQLLYILQRIRQLSFHSQDHAKKLLTDSPQLALALIHAQYIVSGKKLDTKLLPLTTDEIKMSHDRLNLLRSIESNSAVNVIGSGPSAPADVGLSKRFQSKNLRSSGDQASELSRLISCLDPSLLGKVTEGLSGDGTVDSDAMAQAILNLSAEQIAGLPEAVQHQVLRLLEESLTV
jgi:hypothetical protein